MIESHLDAVVMLTWSDWHTELRSNRYHYASRFARRYPVVFVQPDLYSYRHVFEKTELDGVTVLHVPMFYCRKQTNVLNEALRSRGICRPLIWIYNYRFADCIRSCWAPLQVYHATEDYFSSDFFPDTDHDLLRHVVESCDLVLAATEGVRQSCLKFTHAPLRTMVLSNGCDFSFWEGVAQRRSKEIVSGERPVAIYQGGISHKIDFQLLQEVVEAMPDWDFWFCGRFTAGARETRREWRALKALPNVRYLGQLRPDELRETMSRATVGMIPYVQNEYIVKRSWPLKAFEFLACGIPTVSVPIYSLAPFSDFFKFATDAAGFQRELRLANDTALDEHAVWRRVNIARAQDYDDKFDSLMAELAAITRCNVSSGPSAHNILVLYASDSTHVSNVVEDLRSFHEHSKYNIFYAPATLKAKCDYDLNCFDAVLLHSSVRVSLDWHLSSSYAEGLGRYRGLKGLFIQDDYDTTDVAHRWIDDLGLHVVWTAVPEHSVAKVYPPERFPHTEFISSLTGYIPRRLENLPAPKSLGERRYWIGYRGRELPYWYGTLGQEKKWIGEKMKPICAQRGIPANIEWENERRIYGPSWYDFVQNCRAILGTESGSNVFDLDGSISENVKRLQQDDPTIGFEEVRAACFKDRENTIDCAVISPKVFEAIALRTALVLFEGNYSGIVQPDVHYISLKKDFSNVDEVLRKVGDLNYLEEMTERAHRDIVRSGRYSYRSFMEKLDGVLARHLSRSARLQIYPCANTAVDHVLNASRGFGVGDPTSLPSLVVPEWPLPPRRQRHPTELVPNFLLQSFDQSPKWLQKSLITGFRWFCRGISLLLRPIVHQMPLSWRQRLCNCFGLKT